MNLRNDELERLLQLVHDTADQEIDCDEFHARVAAYVEALPAGAGDGRFVRLRQHLSVCPECAEDLEALRRALDGLGGEESPGPR
ncbi:MAG: hypothetical protein H6807_01795 [Planctomycetes bacterium]|nr:hypothetical protein [Planctomycetota bacterium]